VTLRAKLILAQAPLGLALALVAAASLTALSSLGRSPELTLRANFRSILAGERILRAAAELDELALRSATGRPADPRARQSATGRLESELRAQEGNITEPGEAEATRELRARWTRFASALEELLATPAPARLDRYYVLFVPARRALQDGADEILALNQDAMQRRSEEVRRESDRTTSLVLGATAAAVVGGLLLALWLTARLLHPLGVLARTVRRIGEGDLDVQAPITGNDEIAGLGREFNTMAAHLRQYRSSSLGELLQAQQAAQSAIDSLLDPVLVVDAAGAILNMNGAAEALFRRSPGEGPTLAALDPELRATVERVRAHVLGGRGAYVPRGYDESVGVEGGDGTRRLLPRGSPLYSEEGAITAATIVLQDVTRLMRFDELKSDLVATVAHEFRTPLTSLRMAIHLCAEQLVDPEKQLDLLYSARGDCERLQGIVDDLLDLSRIQSGKLELSLVAAQPGTLAEEAVRSHRAAAGTAGVRLEARVGEHLPAVRVDADRVVLVLSNLLSNAIRYSPGGGTVELLAAAGDDAVRFEVKDAGPGIPREYHERIFEKFFRLPGAPPGGVGLGLYLAREIVEAHGGRIGVESAPGLGSRFWFTVPVAQVPAEASPTLASPQAI
jgi:signal transduction histidine kinase